MREVMPGRPALGRHPSHRRCVDAGYPSGMKGVLQGSDGKSFNFDPVPDKLKDQACDPVLKNASSLI